MAAIKQLRLQSEHTVEAAASADRHGRDSTPCLAGTPGEGLTDRHQPEGGFRGAWRRYFSTKARSIR